MFAYHSVYKQLLKIVDWSGLHEFLEKTNEWWQKHEEPECKELVNWLVVGNYIKIVILFIWYLKVLSLKHRLWLILCYVLHSIWLYVLFTVESRSWKLLKINSKFVKYVMYYSKGRKQTIYIFTICYSICLFTVLIFVSHQS